ncbi:hypothetical protein KUTeg_005191 [Tegillarca granosa]|uniref:Uncharacterized protein n=1 Tax=Tegillarca granosa TaxID=220873 RepID=A0ABQ9FJ11_TEGGR|nr:hypothetical protein KUTeg_005191 [Tegillarca granosa]
MIFKGVSFKYRLAVMVANFCLEYFSHHSCMNEKGLGPDKKGQNYKCSWDQNSVRTHGHHHHHHQLARSLSASAAYCSRGWSLIQQDLQPQVSTTTNTTSANQRTSLVSTSQTRVPLHLTTQVHHSRSRPQMTVGNLQATTRYEASREICPPVTSPSSSAGQQTATLSENASWDGNKNIDLDIKTDDIYQMDTGSVVSGPTLAELNSCYNSELNEDIGNIMTSDGRRHSFSEKPITSFKTEPQTSATASSTVSSPTVWSYLQNRGNLKSATASSRPAASLSDWTALTQTVLSADQLMSQTPMLSRAGAFSTSTSASKVPQASAKSSPALQNLLQQNVYDESEESQEVWKTGNTKDSKPKKERQYFWQYNIQSKGPKGTRVDFGMDTSDPHVLHDFEDPVFDPHTCTIVGMGTAIRHGGKARKGDGNDVSPNPKKLCQIGQQLKRLNKQINSFAPLNELPISTRNKSKKEKNKLASSIFMYLFVFFVLIRACRLKKKAQHEANKLKLYGLELEHKQLMKVLQRIREELKIKIGKDRVSEEEDNDRENISMSSLLEDLIKENLTDMVAGNAAEYVSKITKRVDEGDPTGGLTILDQT